MTTKVSVPQLGESVVEATVGKWLVEEGQRVDKDQPLVELLTDKTDTEINAPVAGVVVKLLHGSDEVVAVGETLCEIDEAVAASAGAKPAPPAPASPAPAPAPASAESPAASPAVRKVAREEGVDLGSVRGTGERGRITREDVLRAAGGAGHAPTDAAPAAAPPPAPVPEAPARAAPVPAMPRPAPAVASAAPARQGAFRLPPYVPQEGDEVIPFTRRRRIIADHMVFSKHVAPDVVTFAECDLELTHRVREQHKGKLRKEGVNLTFLAFACAAVCRALREFPELNARVLDDAYVLLRQVNLGIAVDTDDGLVVPVIRDADELTVKGLSRAIADLAERARDGKLMPDDLAGKTFTVSNPGRRGNLVGGAIISQPNVGILRLGTIKKRVVVMEHEGHDLIAIHPVMYMALTYDHRVVDGVKANGFLYRVTELLESGELTV